ncbi:hypothetical protein PR202_gb00981 [Eleusine coracana subsp. coracana]|uniref:Uncharacterized protein n=1 Tax=Eleusine coracana subsp. coracana TaxID=191504 RepID=A0AAV5DVE4_ELECO|nr:hypothetical protein PR202_gb00981 [Eleusine coracana subsp. coracana]
MLGEGPWEEREGPDDMWLKMATCVRKVASEVFDVSRGGKQEAKDTWWNDEVQRAIKEKECFKRLHLDKSAANIEGYKIAKRTAKRAVSVAKGQAYDNLYQRLGTKEGEKDIYRMARIRERKTRDINQIKYIKDGVDRLLVRDEEIKDRWPPETAMRSGVLKRDANVKRVFVYSTSEGVKLDDVPCKPIWEAFVQVKQINKA